jgi:hypothetical protein
MWLSYQIDMDMPTGYKNASRSASGPHSSPTRSAYDIKSGRLPQAAGTPIDPRPKSRQFCAEHPWQELSYKNR